ncbi:MAG: FAD-dependent oxidoreductase [Alphaproteobacteria bacterium]
MSGRRVAVVGAGIIGTTCALVLQTAGFRVTLFDPEPPGRGASYGNAGSLSAGGVVPMALPGMLKQVPRWLFDSQGPLSVRWRHLPRAAPWLARWILASRWDRVERASDGLAPLVKPSVDLYRALLPGDQAAALIRQTGQLNVSRNSAAGPGEAPVERLRRRHGVRVEMLDENELRQLEPALAPAYRRGVFLPDSGLATDPLRLTQTLADLFAAAGGTLRRSAVDGFEMRDGVVGAVRAGGAAHAVDTVVIAAGIHSRSFARRLGDRVPLESERGYHVEVESPEVRIDRPISDLDRKYFVSPIGDRLRFAGTVEIAGLAAPPDYRRAHVLGRLGRTLLPGLAGVEDKAVWMGHRPSTPDSLPVIDRASKVANAVYAFGHGHLGLTAAPATADLVLALVRGKGEAADLAPYRVGRF